LTSTRRKLHWGLLEGEKGERRMDITLRSRSEGKREKGEGSFKFAFARTRRIRSALRSGRPPGKDAEVTIIQEGEEGQQCRRLLLHGEGKNSKGRPCKV